MISEGSKVEIYNSLLLLLFT